ncbi:MAG: hypothetical protein ACE5F1_11110 [Planctomycetota bacterium]
MTVQLPFLLAAMLLQQGERAGAAQREETAAVERLLVERACRYLRSGTNRLVAWGAYLAARHRLRETRDLLLERLEPRTSPSDNEAWFARLALLDALIRLETPVPASRLGPLGNEVFPAQQLILLARNLEGSQGDENVEASRRVLTGLFDQETQRVEAECGVRWRALGNLMAIHAAPALYPRLLSSLELEVTVVVWEGRKSLLPRSGGFRNFRWEAPAGFPPAAFYLLDTRGGLGDVLLAAGPRPVYYRRIEFARRQFCCGGGTLSFPDPDELRLEWLAAALDRSPSETGLRAKTYVSHPWKGPGPLLEEALRIRRDLGKAHRELLRALGKARLIPTDLARRALPRVRFHVADQRADRSTPLPRLD